MWRLINRLVDTPSLCLYCIFACFKTYEFWHHDYYVYIFHVPYYTLNLVIMCVRIYLLMFVSICFIRLCVAWLPFFFFMMHVWMLCSFATLTCWLHRLILLLALAYDSSCCMIILLSLTCMFSFLSISFVLAWLILFIVYYLVYLNILFILVIYLSCLSCFLLSLCVDMDDIHVICLVACCMTTLLLCDACVACLCGTHIYPLISNSLVSIDLVSLDLIFDMGLVTLFALRLS